MMYSELFVCTVGLNCIHFMSQLFLYMNILRKLRADKYVLSQNQCKDFVQSVRMPLILEIFHKQFCIFVT